MFQVNAYIETKLINCSRAMSHEEATRLQEECQNIRSALWSCLKDGTEHSIFFKIERAF